MLSVICETVSVIVSVVSVVKDDDLGGWPALGQI